MWRSNAVPVGPPGPGSAYDDVWQGGFEELFPNDAPTETDGMSLPDHGELWSTPWTVFEKGDDFLTLGTVGPIAGLEVFKTLRVDGSIGVLKYRLSHKGDQPLNYLFKLHPAIAIDEQCRIELPGGSVEKVDPSFGNLLGVVVAQPWPTDVDLSRCRAASSTTNEFAYVSDLPIGTCGVVDERAGARIRIDYPREFFPYCWLFITYGGWCDHNVVVLEPCTNYPKDLEEAASRGTCPVLPPGEVVEFEVMISVGPANE